MPSKISVEDAIKASDAAFALGLKDDIVLMNAYMKGVDDGYNNPTLANEAIHARPGEQAYYHHAGACFGAKCALNDKN